MTRILIASDWAPIRAFEPVISRDPEAVYGDMLPILRAADLRIVNCECALTAARKPVWKSGAVFKGLPAHVAGLAAVPFEVATPGQQPRLRLWPGRIPGDARRPAPEWHPDDRRGDDVRGGHRAADTDRQRARASPSSISAKARTSRRPRGGPGVCGWEIDRLAGLIRKAKKRGDFVIAIGHAGLEYVPFPPPYVVEAFRALSDAGADCVVGHHPHVPQGLEVRRGRLIAYSLGNFAFFQPPELQYRRTGFCLSLDVRAGRLASYEIHPYRIADERGSARSTGERSACSATRSAASPGPFKSARGVAEAWQAYLAYYGPEGFKKEVLGILEKMDSEPRKGAAMFRNRITTLQHAELWRDALTRFMSEKPVPARPAWTRLIDEWLTRPLPPMTS